MSTSTRTKSNHFNVTVKYVVRPAHVVTIIASQIKALGLRDTDFPTRASVIATVREEYVAHGDGVTNVDFYDDDDVVADALRVIITRFPEWKGELTTIYRHNQPEFFLALERTHTQSKTKRRTRGAS